MLHGESSGQGMFSYMSALCLPRSNSCSIYSSQLRQRYAGVTIRKSFYSSSVGSQASEDCTVSFVSSKHKGNFKLLTMATIVSLMGRQLRLGLAAKRRSMSLRLSLPAREKFSKISWNARYFSWKAGGASVGLCLSFSTSGSVHAEASVGNNAENNEYSSSSGTSHGKKVYTDYSITGIPGDGRCLFRSMAHGACICSGKPLPDEDLQRELADELRARVADEFVKRRAETEWFVEGDFDTYVSQIRKPHVWGGEPELFMASHVLRMPITVYMLDEDAGGLIAIAEYGQEYGKEDPIRVLYYGFGHYDALQIPGKKGPKSRL
ncbi:OTU domain-containing protein [Cocos nucifera]|uniref:Ubiquitin thioesterase OTU n=1 Tax=Cocos nucifera TaxID=13894 RepID=A0A8K0HV52_COCNU|nr:OTU domain-containing protein [Cocos nucifera]